MLQAALVVGVWVAYLARRDDRGEAGLFFAVCAAAVTVFVALGKVLSPQFLIWLVPLIALAAGGRGLAAAGAFLFSLVLTQLWFPKRYWDLVDLEPYPTWLLVARNIALLLLAALLAIVIARPPERSHSP
jgi:hypothetical protein